ncbi:MAG: class I SAM-dependent methyltransferase [Deltaproteobacteria bacterium]|nr:class I SAM-dependent methyltransferase [Deltaproteobacteria bacterium]MCB9488001.1 class I SAM-dependent methyltransferase [Deltaproteobacteria bacterium]
MQRTADAPPGSILDDKITHDEYLNHQRARRRALARQARRVAEAMRRHGATGPLLDLGVGTGIGMPYLCDALDAGDAVGVDIDPTMVRFAEAETAGRPDIRVEQADARALPFDDGRFGAVYCEYVFHHVEGVDAAIAEIHRVLRPGGVFFLIDIDPANGISRLFKRVYPYLRAIGLGWHGGEGAYQSILRAPHFDALHRMLDEIGFVERERRRSKIRRELLLVKP